MGQQKVVAILMTIATLLPLVGCGERQTSAEIVKGPSFLLCGSGRLASLRIYGPQPDHKIATPFDGKLLVWRVQPPEGYFKGAPVSRLVREYGIVPKGYVQTTPVSGTATVLPTGQVYYFFAETTDAPPAQGFFYLDGNTPVEISVPDLCESGFVHGQASCGEPGEFTVEILNFWEIPTKVGFPNPPHASEPDDGSLLPRAFEQFQPESSVYHTKLYLHIVALNENAFSGAL